MGDIRWDIAIENEEKRMQEMMKCILSIGTSFAFTQVYQRCVKCWTNIVAHVITADGDEMHIIRYPCTRIVIGIYPSIRNAIEKEIGNDIAFGQGESWYFCQRCIGWTAPERIAAHVPEVAEGIRLGRVPIIDSGRNLIKDKGCWITVTEFPLNRNGRNGRFLNYQTSFPGFVCTLSNAGLGENKLLAPFQYYLL